MTPSEKNWAECARAALESYDASLLRQVAETLCRPRNQWPAAELVDRCLATLDNAATLDRRLKDLDPAARRLLVVISHSSQSRWQAGSVVELAACLGEADPGAALLALLNAGLMYPIASDRKGKSKVKRFDAAWLEAALTSSQNVWVAPLVVSRGLNLELELGDLPAPIEAVAAAQEADGMEWPLRFSAVWQQVRGNPLRRTQQGDFFKRDLDRLRGDSLLTSAGDAKAEVPDAALLAVAWALSSGLLRDDDGEIHAADFPEDWQQGLSATVASLWRGLLAVGHWSPTGGWDVADSAHAPYASAFALCLIALGKMPRDAWITASAIARWTAARHPHWAAQPHVLPFRSSTKARSSPDDGLETFLLGLAYPLKLVQAAQHSGQWLVRLSPLGRAILGFSDETVASPAYPQTLLVQPNLEVLVYRQGLTPALVARLSRFADWKTLGAACTAQLQASTVYSGLEAGESFESIVDLLNRHGMKPMPASVVESLRTWANKRERISLYPSAALLEFASADLLNDAVARGVPAVRISDRLAIVTNEASIDYRHFKLVATRDYTLPPEKCVDIEPDGVTLSIDVGKSDLLLETEVSRFAEAVPQPSPNGRRFFRLTPSSLNTARTNGFDLPALESWFAQRSQQPLSPAARLLLGAGQTQPLSLKQHLVLHVADEMTADGLQQWPGTRALVEGRLGPTALLVLQENVDELKRRLGGLGVSVES